MQPTAQGAGTQSPGETSPGRAKEMSRVAAAPPKPVIVFHSPIVTSDLAPHFELVQSWLRQ
jgi:hypothetical protein